MPAALFVLERAFANRWWAQPPTVRDRLEIAIEAALPFLVCIITATLAERRRNHARHD